jgi:hypothetical protein
MIFSVIIVKILALPAVASAKHNRCPCRERSERKKFSSILTFDNMWEANLLRICRSYLAKGGVPP